MLETKVIVFGNGMQGAMGLVRALGEKGLPVHFIMEPCKKSECGLRLSKYIAKISYLEKLEDAIQVLLKEYASEGVRHMVYCSSDAAIALLDQHYEELKDYFVIFNAKGEQGRINHFLDKVNAFEIAKRCGLTLIPTWEITADSPLPETITYPCLVKAENSVKSNNKGDMHICSSKEELTRYLRAGVDYLLQEYIQKDYEVDIVGFSSNHGQDVFIPGVIRKIRETLVKQSAFIRLDSIKEYPTINLDGIKQLVKEIGYEGIFSAEFLCQGDTSYFLEINLRNDGAAYIYAAAGANYPYLWYLYGTGKLTQSDIDFIQIKTPFYMMQDSDLYNIVEGRVPLLQWLKDFHRTDAFFTMNWRDPLPFVWSCLIHARQLCKKIMHFMSISLILNRG